MIFFTLGPDDVTHRREQTPKNGIMLICTHAWMVLVIVIFIKILGSYWNCILACVNSYDRKIPIIIKYRRVR